MMETIRINVPVVIKKEIFFPFGCPFTVSSRLSFSIVIRLATPFLCRPGYGHEDAGLFARPFHRY